MDPATNNNDEELIATVYRKIEREKALIHAASNLKQSTGNTLVQQRAESNIRDGRKNIAYLEEKMRELQIRRAGRDGDDGSGPSSPNAARNSAQQQRMMNSPPGSGAPTPPPKDAAGNYFGQGSDRGDYGNPGPGGYSGGGGRGMMPPRAPYGDPRPYAGVGKTRPNYSKLGESDDLVQTMGIGS